MLRRTLSKQFADPTDATEVQLWPRRVLLDHSLSLWHPTGSRLTVETVRSVAETMSNTMRAAAQTKAATDSKGHGFQVLEKLWLSASNSVLHWKKEDAVLLFSYYMLLMQILETNALSESLGSTVADFNAAQDTASGAERLSQFVVFLFAQLYHHTDVALKQSQKFLVAGGGAGGGVDQPALKAALLSTSSDKAHEQNEAAPISPSKKSKKKLGLGEIGSNGGLLTVDTESSLDMSSSAAAVATNIPAAVSPPRSSSSSSSSSFPSSSSSSSSSTSSPTTGRSVAIQSRAEDDAEHLMFVESHLEMLMDTLQSCFPMRDGDKSGGGKGGKSLEEDRLSDAAMSGVELLLSGPDIFAVRDRQSKNEKKKSGGNGGDAIGEKKSNNDDGSLLEFIRSHLVVCEPLSSELHHTPTLDVHGCQRTTMIQTLKNCTRVTEGVVTKTFVNVGSNGVMENGAPPTMDIEGGESVKEVGLQDVHVANCHGSFLYMLLPVRFAVVQSCEDCTIVVGACQGVLSLERCTRVTIMCCGQQLRVSNCIDCTVHTYTTHPPVLLGDNRGLKFAPYNTFYHDLPTHLQCTGLITKKGTPRNDEWNNVINLDDTNNGGGGGSRGVASSSSALFKRMDPEEFVPFEIPSLMENVGGGEAAREREKSAAASCLPPTPVEYSRALQRKVSFFFYFFFFRNIYKKFFCCPFVARVL